MLIKWLSWRSKPSQGVTHTHQEHLAMGLKKALEAERRVADIVNSHESITHVWLGKRVPNPDTLHSRGEVDVIALAKNGDVFCCEVKNFAGEIVEENGDVVQTKLAIRGKSKPILPKLLQKSECIKRYLNSKTNSKWLNVHPLLVLANEFAQPSKGVLELQQVTTIHGLLETVDSKLTQDTHLSQSQINRMIDQISSFNSYDTVLLVDQAFKQGDIINSPWNRQEFEQVKIRNVRGRILTLILGKKYEAIGIDYDGNSHPLETDIDVESIIFSEPWGKKGNTKIPLSKCQTIKFGGRTVYSYQTVPKTNGKQTRSNIAANNATKNSTFVKGQQFHDKEIVRHLVDNKGATTGLLVELEPDRRPALLNISKLQHIDCTMFKTFFAEGKTIDVEIENVKANGDIQLKMI